MKDFIKHLIVGVLFSCLAIQVHSENLVSIKSRGIPSLAGTASTIFTAADVPFIVQDERLWKLDETDGQWIELKQTQSGRIRGSIDSGPKPYLLLESQMGQGIDHVEIFSEGVTPSQTSLPALDFRFTRARGAVDGKTLYIAGIETDGSSHWLSIDLDTPHAVWKPLVPWSTPSVDVTGVVAQYSALYVSLKQPGGAGDKLLRWSESEGWIEKATLPGSVVDGSARAMGQAHILMLIHRGDSSLLHTGSQLTTYHAITESFSNQGAAFAEDARLATRWKNGLLWEFSGAQPSTSTFKLSEVEGNILLLRPLDWVMIVIYLVSIAGIGVYCFWREEKQSTSEFFVGNRTIPFWAAAVSLYVTSTSSIGYIATTAKAFATNWQYLVNNLIGVFGLIFVAIWIVPMLRRLRLVSVFDYLEQRFHPSVRLMASAMCILLHLGGRMSIILFLPSLAIATITGFDMRWSILIMGLVTIGYTALGGMKAVIWTDILQFVVKVGGLIFVLGFILSKLDGGVVEFVTVAEAADKMKMLDWSFDLTKATVWGFLFLVLMEIVLTFPKDQVLMQRVFTTKSDKEAGKSVWLFAALILPAGWLFYLIGTGLWVFYQSHPERMNPLLSVDATFPLFIAAELPAGVTGLIIAGIFAASMATCSSIINSVATMVSVDFYERLATTPTQKTSIRLAEFTTAIAGAIGIGLALLLSSYNIASYLDTALELYGILGGGFGGAYTLGMFTRRANWQGVLIGMFASMVLTFVAWWFHLVHPFLYLAIAVLISIVFGYIGSLFFPPPKPESLKGLVIER